MKINVHRVLVAVFFALVLNACGQNPKQLTIDNGQLTIKNIISVGVVVEKIKCSNDSLQSYAVYLPSTYSTDKKYPVIYFFDPHAKGKLPVTKYKALAEKYGYILIGSNNSKNSDELDKLTDIVKNLFADSQNKISIDGNKIYTCGFSGGARVAGLICSSNSNIKGVIACGAAFPLPEEEVIGTLKFDYIGFAGNADFNLIEMKELDRALEGKAINHKLVIFEGKHEWPAENKFEEAFVWLQNPITEAAQTVTAADEANEFKEKQKMQYYAANLKSKDANWWKDAVDKLNTDIKSSTDKEIVLQNKRVLNYLSLAAYMVSTGVLNSGDVEKAKKLLEIYSMIDPENPEPAYLFAEIFCKEGNTKKAIKLLQESVKLGFDDFERISKDNAFITLKDNKDFKDILEKVKNKK